MIYALILAVLSVPVTTGVSLFVFSRYVAHRDALDASERAALLQRIQDPETAVAEHSVRVLDHDSPAYLPFDDDEAFMTYTTEQRG